MRFLFSVGVSFHVERSSICCSQVLDGCRWAQRGDMWEASDIMQKMRQEGLTPDVHSYTSFVNACCKAGDMQVALLRLWIFDLGLTWRDVPNIVIVDVIAV